MPLLTLLGQKSTTHTIGGTTQLSGFGSSGGLNVFSTITIGGTDQLAAFGSSGGLNVFTVHTVGGTDQLLTLGASGGIQVGTAITAHGSLPPKRVKTRLRKKDEEILEQIYELVAKLEEVPAPKKLVDRVKRVEVKAKKAIQVADTTRHDRQLASTRAQIDRLELAINTHIKAFKQDEEDAIQALLSIL